MENHTHKKQKEWLIQLANNLNSNKTNLATTITTDMGKPINEAIKEVEKCIECCKFYATKSAAIEKIKTHQRIPISTWGYFGNYALNFPLWQLIRFIVPAVIVGNARMIKPAYNTYRIALALIYAVPAMPVSLTALSQTIIMPPN